MLVHNGRPPAASVDRATTASTRGVLRELKAPSDFSLRHSGADFAAEFEGGSGIVHC